MHFASLLAVWASSEGNRPSPKLLQISVKSELKCVAFSTQVRWYLVSLCIWMKINLCKTFHSYSIKKAGWKFTELFDSTTVVSIFLLLEHDSHSILNRTRTCPQYTRAPRRLFNISPDLKLMFTRKQKNVEDVISCVSFRRNSLNLILHRHSLM